MNTTYMDEYYEWWSNRPPEVLRMCEKIIKYEMYFTDMSLNENGLLKDYIANPLWDYIEPPEELLLHNPSSYFKIYVGNLKDCNGCVNVKDRILAIDNDSADKREVILHEMIHAHEILLEEKNTLLRDVLLFELYKKLKPIFSNLDEIIRKHANFFRYNQTIGTGGTHDILFLLKSLELDTILNVRPGTVFGYDADISK